jgi:hypothetical protein
LFGGITHRGWEITLLPIAGLGAPRIGGGDFTSGGFNARPGGAVAA